MQTNYIQKTRLIKENPNLPKKYFKFIKVKQKYQPS
jgi:hypothetical protein